MIGAAILLMMLSPSAGSEQAVLDRLGITVRGTSREVAYTNKTSAFYYTESHGSHRSSWQGLNVAGEELLEDYTVIVGDSALDRSGAESVVVYPDRLERRYRGGTLERVFLTDSLSVLCLEIEAPTPTEVAFIPWFAGARSGKEISVALRDRVALITFKGLSDRREHPLALAAGGAGVLPVARDTSDGNRSSPVMLVSGRGRNHRILFVAAERPDDAATIVRGLDVPRQAARRRARMERLLRASEVRSADTAYAMSLAWSKLSLDALIMSQRGVGIFAGLPWFNNYWGRDTFIALPGATLVTGRFAEAAAILRAFAAHQNTQASSTDYGRIPNFVSLNDVAYNTADGTPRFVMMAREYVERAGDERFAAEVYPTVLRSIEGTLRHHTDSLGFLTHGDAETWMDAVGPAGPWSPRGNRANDIQALWEQQLAAGVWFATRLGDARSAREWDGFRRKLRASFPRHFVRGEDMADRLLPDGTPDFTLRPNQIFAAGLLEDSLRGRVVATVVSRLTYPHGVASLCQLDDRFHPFHRNEPFYPKDAAYHNGTVWTWVQGAVISELCRAGERDLAFRVTANTARQILDHGAVGTQSELLDALPRSPGAQPEPSGTFSQAWNLAEYIRNFYDDYLGIRVSLLTGSVTIRPRIPDGLVPLTARIPCGDGALTFSVKDGPEGYSYALSSEGLPDTLSAELLLEAGNGRAIRTTWRMAPRSEVAFTNRGAVLAAHPLPPGFRQETSGQSVVPLPEALFLAEPFLRADLPSLRGPRHPLIQHSVIRSTNPLARPFCRAADPAGDDTGTVSGTRYTYPGNRAFAEGCFDLRALEIRVDSANAYVRLQLASLANPGWHPEYGFQLTYLAMVIDTDGRAGTGAQRVEQNGNWTLPGRRGYERLILIGGGVRILDSAGTIVAEYIPLPEDVADPLGNAGAGTIEFAIPLSYLGIPDPDWTITVLAGAQDDHGGAGIGEFRTVNAVAGDWNGGGRKRAGDPNVYDTLVARPHH